jgi:hypothetical protein
MPTLFKKVCLYYSDTSVRSINDLIDIVLDVTEQGSNLFGKNQPCFWARLLYLK